MLQHNFLFYLDSYKHSHPTMYPSGLTSMYSYLEARGPSDFSNQTVFFGLQYYLQKYLAGTVLTREAIEDFAHFANHHFGSYAVFPKEKWLRLLDKHGGRLPLRIKAVPEGTVVPISNVLMTIESTDPEFAWLTNTVETLLLKVWYPITVASLSFSIKKVCHNFLKETCDPDRVAGHLQFMLHDFGYRGVSSEESAAIGDAAHLINFMGTDTLASVPFLESYYDQGAQCPAYSVPATEHSVMTMLGENGEAVTIQKVLDAYPTGILSIVCDSYDPFRFVDILGTQFADQIRNRNGRVVVRPDSGDPVKVSVQMLERIGQYFSPSVNSKGYKVLPDYIRVIYGDGINYHSIGHILAAMKAAGWAAENIIFGMGGALLQSINRDTFAMAVKCSHVVIDGESVDVYKKPATQSSKSSKRGRLGLLFNDDGFATVSESRADIGGNHLQTVFENGDLIAPVSFDEVRRRAADWFES